MNYRSRNKRHRQNDTARERALRAIAAMRRGASFSKAARENSVTTRTIKTYAKSALVQDRPGRRIRATKNDRLVRYLQIPGADGPIEIKVRGSKAASEAAKYKAAVNRFLRGDANGLSEWKGIKIGGVEVLTSPSAIKDLAEKDLVPYSLYKSFNGGAA